MTRRRLLVAAVGAGLLLASLPASAAVDRGRVVRTATAHAEAAALLERAAAAGRRLHYSGTQYVASWRAGVTDSSVVELEHHPVRGTVVDGVDGGPPAAGPTATLDPRMLDRLVASYDLSVAGPGRCTGREATVVEARRAGGALAGRFWVDQDTGMLLRREVFDDDGQRVTSAAFVDLSVAPGHVPSARVVPGRLSGAERPAPAALDRLRADGWHVPDSLPGDLRLIEVRRDGAVLHLAYTDGLSALSLFAQRGGLGEQVPDGFVQETVAGAPVWVRRTAPERVVWQGDGQVWTLVTDAPESTVREVVAALPHAAPAEEGLLARLERGGSRLAGMLNPFD